MKALIQKYIDDHGLFAKQSRLLVAVSGGVDSVVLAHVLNELEYDIAIAHCNFQLRGAESDGDEQAVHELAKRLGVECHVKAFDTRAEVEASDKSVQMVARDLRYAWFRELCSSCGYSAIAVAHHKNDQAETVLLNMVRGSGLRGLGGMKPGNHGVVRPLLCVDKEQLLTYAETHKLEYRNDASNEQDDYRRNFLRNNVIQLLQSMNPSVVETIAEQAEFLQDAAMVLDREVKRQLAQIATDDGVEIRVEIAKLKALRPMRFYLYELLRLYRFNSKVIADVELGLDGASGKRYYSDTHQLLKDRDFLIITVLPELDQRAYHLPKEVQEITTPLHLTFEELPAANFRIPTSKSIACLDTQKLKYPLELRHWKQGDFFYPLGMENKKLLSDFFIDNKFSVLEKAKTWLLVSADDIVWVVGHRIDNRFRVHSDSQMVTKIELR